MRSLKILITLCALFAVLVFLTNLEIAPKKLGATPIQIADKNFIVPTEFDYWKYTRQSTEGYGFYNQLEFTLDIDSLKTIVPNFSPSVNNNFTVEVRPLASERGEKNYWTQNDPIYKTKPKNCLTNKFDEIEYLFCEHGEKIKLSSWDNKFYSVRQKKSDEYISIIRCLNADKTKLVNPMCHGRTRILGNIQIEYIYDIEHFSKAIELDHSIRKIVSEMQSTKH